MEGYCCIRAFNFGVVDKSDGSILLYKSLQLWSCGQKWWKYTVVLEPSTLELWTKVMEKYFCIRAFNFGVVSKSDGSILYLLYKSLQVWSCVQKWWKYPIVYEPSSLELCPKVMEVSCCIRAFKFGVVSKSDGSILLYKSLQIWSCVQKWWKYTVV